MLAARLEKKTVFDSLILQWARAWESRDMVSFAAFYDTVDFQGQGLAWNSFRTNKERTFALYDTIAIGVKNMVVRDISDTSATVIFTQTYRSDKTRSTGNKKLSLAHRDGAWKITRELTTANGERPL